MTEPDIRSLIRFRLEGELEALWTCLAVPRQNFPRRLHNFRTMMESPPKLDSPLIEVVEDKMFRPNLKRRKSADIFTSRKNNLLKPVVKKKIDSISQERIIKHLKENVLSSNVARSFV